MSKISPTKTSADPFWIKILKKVGFCWLNEVGKRSRSDFALKKAKSLSAVGNPVSLVVSLSKAANASAYIRSIADLY